MASSWLSADEASRALRVKPETLYAYVSRGLLTSEREPGSRRSRYRRGDVERLAGRQRAGGRAGGLEIIEETELTLLDPAGHLYYRGWDVARAVDDATFEVVATWLWTGCRDATPIDATEEMTRRGRRVTAALGGVAPVDRLRSVLAAVRGADPLRHDRRPAAVAATARTIVATMIESMPPLQDDVGSSVAARLWCRLTERRPTKKDVALLDASLVLLADHELAASTLAARVAASTWADPYLVVLAGLATLGGPLHGGASEQARALVREVVGGRSAAEAIGARLVDGQLIPGFGHRVYAAGDPRADVLLARVSRSSPSGRAGSAILETMEQRDLPFPNIDFALALLAEGHHMIPGASELVFAVARVVGWLAHAIEEYEHRLRWRPRAAYVGVPPGA